jgi:asparagine synthase (glutamine-hydrolysing)
VCGLFASIGLKPERFRLTRVAHRGPDGEGWQEFSTPAGPLALGHRRLAIIDLDLRARQPMSCPNGRYKLIFNGEIYNYIELKNTLRKQGASFSTSSDAEVLLQAFIKWGPESLKYLRGMFSFIVFDTQTNIFFAARDAYGIKPLYYVQTKNGIAFGSEPKQLFDIEGVDRRLNLERAWDFIVSQTTDHTDETLFVGLRQIRPGHCLTLDLTNGLDGTPITAQRWFELPQAGGLSMSLSGAAQEFRRKFESSVTLHLRADVPVGACLSGGLDSSSIVGIASRLRGSSDPIRTFTVVFPGTGIDEGRFARAVVEHTNAIPTEVHIRDDEVEAATRLAIWHQDEPFGSTSILAQWFVFQAIGRSGTKVVLDGQGADEQLAGYHGLFSFHHASLLRRKRYFSLAGAIVARRVVHGVKIGDATGQFGRRIGARIHRLFERTDEAPVPMVNLLSKGQLAQVGPKEGSTLNAIVARDALPSLDTIGELCLAMVAASNLTMLLRYEDRNSMAHSVEARVPFVDPELIAFNIGLGEHHKLVGADTKRVLRRAMNDVLPAMVANRRDKLGFSTPESAWMAGPLASLVIEGLDKAEQRFPDLLDWRSVHLMRTRLFEGDGSGDPHLWRIANLGLWAEVFDVSSN